MESRIVQEGESPALRSSASEIDMNDFGTDELKTTVEMMFYLLRREKDGVALAAPQVGLAKRIFVVSPQVFKKPSSEQLVYINPRLLKKSKSKSYMQEGCLSVRWLYGDVERYEQVIIEAHDVQGKKFQRGASGLLAQIFQHEMDHLDGTLFIDKAKNVERLSDDHIEQLKNS